MWAFVIYDAHRRTLFASRDRFGVKPLYRFSDGRQLILASEIKAVLALCPTAGDTNWEAAGRFLGRGLLDDSTATFYKHIDQIRPGSALEIDLRGRVTERLFWSIAALRAEAPAEPVGVFRELFQDSVRLRMRSDVPVGVCLSGGIDSSAIISMMASMRPGPPAPRLQAFSYIPDAFSEAEYIDQSIARTGAELNVLKTNPAQLWDLLPTAMWHYDEPVHSPTALIGFQLMRLARRRGVTVVLNGQGADEVNAGYHAYFPAYWADLMRQGRWRYAFGQIQAYAKTNDQAFRPALGATLGHWMHRLLRDIPGFARLREPLISRRVEGPSWLDPELRHKRTPTDRDAWARPLEGVLANSIERRPLPLYLRVEDRNSMASSVEARLPFLDYRLVSLAFSLPGEWKLRDGWNKYLVREAVRGVIAEPVRTRRDKMGFPTPSKDWWGGPWYEPMMDALASQSLRECGVIHSESVRSRLEQHRAGKLDASNELFRVAQFGAWLSARGRVVPAEPQLTGVRNG
jgi:asparagine synthase (glutamine-hydrolysing)